MVKSLFLGGDYGVPIYKFPSLKSSGSRSSLATQSILFFFPVLSFNNHKSGNNQVWRDKQVKNPVEWNQATTPHNSKWAKWPWICLSSVQGWILRRRCGAGRTDPHVLFHLSWSTNWTNIYTFQNVPRFCCNPSTNIPRQFDSLVNVGLICIFPCKMWFLRCETLYSK